MPDVPQSITGFEVTPQFSVHFTNGGLRDLVTPYTMEKRSKLCFVAFLALRGELHLTDFLPSGTEQVTVQPGEIHIMAPGYHQSSTAPFAAGTKSLWLHFSFFGLPGVRLLGPAEVGEVLYGHAPLQRWLIPRHLALLRDLDTFVRVHEELRDHVRLWGNEDMGSHQICGYLVNMLHRAFIRQSLRAEEVGRASPALAHVARARSFIRLNFERKISLAEVADAVRLNAAYLSRCFRKVTGERMVDFLLKTRIEAAKSLLAEGTEAPTVKEVAYQTGFSSAIYFCRAFRRLEKQTALQYAEKMRKASRSTAT